jgi:prephenate dehydrogenase
MVHQGKGRADFGVIGYGRFGTLAARHLAEAGAVIAWDQAWEGLLQSIGPDEPPAPLRPVPPVRSGSLAEVCRARVVIFCVPIRALRTALVLARDHFRPGTLVADTCSVKILPCRWMEELLPDSVQILGTHPLFGPDSAQEGLKGHKIAITRPRLSRPDRVREFLQGLGLTVYEVTPEEHDRSMADTQSLVHWLGRALARIEAKPRDLDTMGYRRLLEILHHVNRDSWELYVDLQVYNPFAALARENLLTALRSLDQELHIPDEDGPVSRS